MGKNEPEAKQWFAIRVTYSREMALKEYLDRCRMESFIPMSYKEVIKGERKVRKLVPVIHNLVFVRPHGGVLRKGKYELVQVICEHEEKQYAGDDPQNRHSLGEFVFVRLPQ